MKKNVVLLTVLAVIVLVSSAFMIETSPIPNSNMTEMDNSVLCTMYWQTKTGSTISLPDNKTFSVMVGTNGKIIIINDNNGAPGYNGNIRIQLLNTEVELEDNDYVFNVPSGGSREVVVDEFLTSKVTVHVIGLGLLPIKVFAVSVGYCVGVIITYKHTCIVHVCFFISCVLFSLQSNFTTSSP